MTKKGKITAETSMFNTQKQLDEIESTSKEKPSCSTPMSTVQSTYSYKACHTGFTEIVPNIFLGKKYALNSILPKVDTLVALDSIDGDIWNNWNGNIIYIPITDFSVLPTNIEKEKIRLLTRLYKKGAKMAIFCLGGHGRTGYIASLLLHRITGIKDPVSFIRKNYCEEAVETHAQLRRISEFCNNPEIAKLPITSFGYYNYKGYSASSLWGDDWGDGYYSSSDTDLLKKGYANKNAIKATEKVTGKITGIQSGNVQHTTTNAEPKKKTCWDCDFYDYKGKQYQYGKCTEGKKFPSDEFIAYNNPACDKFLPFGHHCMALQKKVPQPESKPIIEDINEEYEQMAVK